MKSIKEHGNAPLNGRKDSQTPAFSLRVKECDIINTTNPPPPWKTDINWALNIFCPGYSFKSLLALPCGLFLQCADVIICGKLINDVEPPSSKSRITGINNCWRVEALPTAVENVSIVEANEAVSAQLPGLSMYRLHSSVLSVFQLKVLEEIFRSFTKVKVVKPQFKDT